MARLRLTCLLLIVALALNAQRQMTIQQLVTFIKSAVANKNNDRDVADAVRKLKLTSKLDARTVEELQGAGAGRQTMAALREQITATATLPDAPPPEPAPVVVTIPPPSAADQKKILAEIRQNALDYTKNLPNFICNQLTRRYVDTTGSGTGFRPTDRIQEQLSYVDGMENYKVVLVNELPVNNVSHFQLGGTTSSGEFATMLHEIFDPETQTQFEWTKWATLRGRRMHVYSFRVLQTNSKYTIHEDQSGRTIVAGYHGLIFADRDTGLVMRIVMDCDGLEAFPITQVSLDLNYDFVKIETGEYVLPLRADLTSRAGRLMSKNEVEFRLYKKFGAEATIIFDPGDSIPADQLKEQPAKPDPAKK
jgi:hypothetical protein